MRGPVAPPQVPLSASRADTFRDLVLDSVERLERRWPQLADVEFLVLEVPPPVPGETVPLGGSVSAEKDEPARVVVYRRPVEIRSKSRDEQALLVHEVVVEQVAELLGLSPSRSIPGTGRTEPGGGDGRAVFRAPPVSPYGARGQSSTPRSWWADGTSTVPRSSVRVWTVNIGTPSCGRASVRAACTLPPETGSTVSA